MHLTLVLSFPCSRHLQLWPMIMAEMQDMTIERRRIANESSPTFTVAAKGQEQDHSKIWKGVMRQLVLRRFRTPPHDAFPHSALQRRRRRLLAPLRLTCSVRRDLLSAFNAAV